MSVESQIVFNYSHIILKPKFDEYSFVKIKIKNQLIL